MALCAFQSKAELLKFELAALAPCSCPALQRVTVPALSDPCPAELGTAWAGVTAPESRGVLTSLSGTALSEMRDCSQGKGDLHQQSRDERWFFASSKLSSCLKGLSLMLEGHLIDLHISAIPECLLDFTV